MTTDPTWTAFDPDAVPALSGDGGHVVALLTLPGAQAAGWAPELAVKLARAWARSGHRVVLVDLDLARPALHEAVEMDNADGITDAVAFGASVGRVARAVEGDPFLFVSAGTAVADSGSLLAKERWEELCGGFVEAGGTLVAFVPADGDTRERALRHATDVVLVGTARDDPAARRADDGDRIRGWVGLTERSGAYSVPPASNGVVARAREGGPVRHRAPLLLLLVLAVVLVVFAAWWLGYRPGSDASEPDPAVAHVRENVPSLAAAEPPIGEVAAARRSVAEGLTNRDLVHRRGRVPG